jgi:hypothetical protein
MLVVYGINEESMRPSRPSPTWPYSLQRKPRRWSFGTSSRAPRRTPRPPSTSRLVVVDGFQDIARHRGETAAEHLGRELIGNFLMANYDRFFPFLPQHEVAYVGSVQGGHVRALARGERWGGGRGPGPLRPLGGGPDLGRGGRPGEGQGPGPEGGPPGPEGPLADPFGGGASRPRRVCP